MRHPSFECFTDCFGCKVASLSFSVGSVRGNLQGTEGKKAFHGDHRDGGTIGERRAKMIEDAGRRGNQPNELTRKELRDFKEKFDG